MEDIDPVSTAIQGASDVRDPCIMVHTMVPTREILTEYFTHCKALEKGDRNWTSVDTEYGNQSLSVLHLPIFLLGS